VHLGAFQVDGIWLTPDGFNPAERAVYEYKVTWRSSRTFQPEYDFAYMAQAKSYCYGLGVNRAVFIILFIVGDYKGSGPQVVRCEFTYTDEELQENWQMITAHAKLMQEEGTNA